MSKIYPAYLLNGSDHNEIKKTVKEIENNIIKQHNTIDSYSFFAEDNHTQEVVSECNGYSMLSNVKVVKVFNSELLDSKIITKYIEKPCTNTVLILISSKAKKDINKNIVKYVEQFGSCKSFTIESNNELLEVLSIKLNEAKVKYESNVVNYLIERGDGHLSNMDFLVSTIKNFCGDKVFKVSDIPDMLWASNIPSVFEFIDSLFSKNTPKTLRLFRLIINEDDKCIFLISMIYRQLKLLWQIKSLKNLNTKEINRIIGLPQFIINKLYIQEKQFSSLHIEKLIHSLTNLDYSVRTLDKINYITQFEIFITTFNPS